jgi:hypothetical protein
MLGLSDSSGWEALAALPEAAETSLPSGSPAPGWAVAGWAVSPGRSGVILDMMESGPKRCTTTPDGFGVGSWRASAPQVIPQSKAAEKTKRLKFKEGLRVLPPA